MGGSNLQTSSASALVNQYLPTHRPLANLPVELSYAGAAAVRSDIYVFGGFSSTASSGGGITNLTVWYNATANAWGWGPDLTESRAFLQGVAIGDVIFALGGLSPSAGFVNSVEKYDTRQLAINGIIRSTNLSNSDGAAGWTRVANMQNKRAQFAAVVFEGGILAIGGVGDDKSSVERYDLAQDSWTVMASMRLPTDLWNHAAVVYMSTVIVAGGNIGSAAVPNVWQLGGTRTLSATAAASGTQTSWIALPAMVRPRDGFALLVFDRSLLLALGGQDEVNFKNQSVEMMNLTATSINYLSTGNNSSGPEWVLGTPLVQDLHALMALVVPRLPG